MIISLSDLFACAKYKRILTFKRDQKNSFISSRFLKINLTKICSHLREEAGQKTGFLDPISSKITLTNKKERRKRMSEEEKEKSNGFTLSFYDGYFGDSFWPEKNCWTQKVHLVITFSKIRLDIHK